MHKGKHHILKVPAGDRANPQSLGKLMASKEVQGCARPCVATCIRGGGGKLRRLALHGTLLLSSTLQYPSWVRMHLSGPIISDIMTTGICRLQPLA